MSINKTISENLLDLLFEYSPNLIFVHDLKGNIIKVNKNLIKALGFKRKGDVLKLHVKDILNYENKDFKLSNYLKLVLNKSKLTEYNFKTKKDSYIPVEGFGFPYKMEKLDVIVNLSSIISEKKKLQKDLLNAKSQLDNLKVKMPEIRLWSLSQKKDSIEILQKGGKVLKESEKKYKDILQNIKEGYFEIDLEGNLVFFNDSLCEILGYSPEELIGKHYRTFIEFEKEKLEEFSNFDEIDGKALEFEFIKKNREKIYVESSLSKKQNTEGILIGFYGLIRNVTKRKEAENKINRKLEFERVISKISSLFINPSSYDEAISTSLELMGNLSNTSRSYLFLFNDINKTMDNTHEWCAKGVIAEKENLQGLPQDMFPWWMAKLNNQEVIHISDVSMMPEERTAEQIILKQQNIKSLLVQPLFIGNLLSGFIGFDNVRETGEWKEEDLFFLQISSEIIGSALKRREIESKLKYSEQSLKSLNIELEQRIILRTKELRESEEKYRLISDNANDIITVFDKKLKLQYINDIYEKISGFSEEEVRGKSPIEFMHPADIKKAIKIFKDSLKIGIWNGEFRMRHKDGSFFWVEVSGKRIYDQNNKAKIIVISRDISERKLIEQKLRESEEKYRKAYNQINFYKDLLTHDISNILQTIKSSVELNSIYLNNPEKLNKIQEIWNLVNSQVIRGFRLISNVRTLSQIKYIQIPIQSIEVYSFLQEAIDFTQKGIQEREIKFQINSPFKTYDINANELLLDVFENILINATKYNENPIIEILIKISKIKIDGARFLKIEFIDNGIGISDDRKKIIFQEGYQKEKQSKGMGLGLSIVKKVIESYNGRIWVEDRVKGDYSKGSNFIILIPEER